jgi:hypothetical protein
MELSSLIVREKCEWIDSWKTVVLEKDDLRYSVNFIVLLKPRLGSDIDSSDFDVSFLEGREEKRC